MLLDGRRWIRAPPGGRTRRWVASVQAGFLQLAMQVVTNRPGSVFSLPFLPRNCCVDCVPSGSQSGPLASAADRRSFTGAPPLPPPNSS